MRKLWDTLYIIRLQKLSYYFLSSYNLCWFSSSQTLTRFREIDSDNDRAPREVFIILHLSWFPFLLLTLYHRATLPYNSINWISRNMIMLSLATYDEDEWHYQSRRSRRLANIIPSTCINAKASIVIFFFIVWFIMFNSRINFNFSIFLLREWTLKGSIFLWSFDLNSPKLSNFSSANLGIIAL